MKSFHFIHPVSAFFSGELQNFSVILFASQMTVCRPACLCTLLTPTVGRSLWWVKNSSDSFTLCYVRRPSPVDLLLVQPGRFYSDRCPDTCHVKNLPGGGLELILWSILDQHLSDWARMGGNAIVLSQLLAGVKENRLCVILPLSSPLDVCRSWKIST